MMFPLQNLRFRWWRELVDIRKGIHMLHARYVSNSTIIHRNAIFVFGQSIVHQQQRNEPKNISFSLFSCKLISIIYLSVRRMRSEQVTIQCGDAVKIPQKKKNAFQKENFECASFRRVPRLYCHIRILLVCDLHRDIREEKKKTAFVCSVCVPVHWPNTILGQWARLVLIYEKLVIAHFVFVILVHFHWTANSINTMLTFTSNLAYPLHVARQQSRMNEKKKMYNACKSLLRQHNKHK